MVRRAWTLGVMLGAGLLGCTAAPPAAPDDLCAIFLERPEWHEASQRSRERWGVAESTQLAFIYQESRFVADARPPRRRLLGFIPAWRRSNAYGYGQVKDGTWSDYRRATSNPRASRLDFADVVDFIGWYAAWMEQHIGVSRGDPYHLYLAYHEGPTGYRRGTYLDKPWLADVATRVKARAARYAAQQATCPRT